MGTTTSCHECRLKSAGATAVSICSACHNLDSRGRFCIAFNEKGHLRPFLTADDEKVMSDCMLKLNAQGHDFTTLVWNDEHYCYKDR